MWSYAHYTHSYLFTLLIPTIFVNICMVYIRVEGGLDDPDNLGHLGHFFRGSSESHPQTKLSGCDPDITYHSKIKKLYLLDVVELIPLTWDYCYILSVSLTVPGRIN